ncbi:hypothetical protein [Variovorax sp. OV329]|uniref:hypothetical protein n=1 Tax=Variovorax sp. OV329 TaxID=1882825 RepID=UPI0008EE5A3D|nr:hypothetical protein [Variovorax sp. OV329]SFM10399.1 hypothetical protein SAMN05444747_102460 [Variovorax sp. OV329]
MGLSNKVAIVTGGRSGAALAHRFVREGASGVDVADISFEAGLAVAARSGQGRWPKEADVRSLVAMTRQHFGGSTPSCRMLASSAPWAGSYGRKGVRVSCLCPQSVDTAMTVRETGSADVVVQTTAAARE